MLAACFLLQAFTASRLLSLTWDEPTFFASGHANLTKRDDRMNPEAPPLMQQLTALPLLALPITPPMQDDPDWIAGEQVGYARTFVYESGVAPETIALAARLPVMLLGAGLVLAIFQFSRRLYGDGPALFATAVAAFSPDRLAHSELAKTDLGCAAKRLAPPMLTTLLAPSARNRTSTNREQSACSARLLAWKRSGAPAPTA